jgi:hypothetical protein
LSAAGAHDQKTADYEAQRHAGSQAVMDDSGEIVMGISVSRRFRVSLNPGSNLRKM